MEKTERYLLNSLKKGDRLFHYTSTEGLLGILGGEFWITESQFLNDVTEFHVATDVLMEVLERNIKNTDTKEILKIATYNQIKRLMKIDERFYVMPEVYAHNGYYVISFCLDKDSILMWSEYSDFCGYCIEFDFDKLIASFSGSSDIKHGKVIYDHKDQVTILEKKIENIVFQSRNLYGNINSWDDFDKINTRQIRCLSKALALDIPIYNMFFKKECFSGENEYRIVFECNHNEISRTCCERETQYFRIKDNVFIPFIKKKLSSLDSVKSILIGPKNKSDIVEKGIKHFLCYHKIKAQIEKSEMPLRY